MADESSKRGAEAKSVPTIDGLTINVVFELGEKKLSLGELKAMQPGYTFDLEKDPEKPVAVRANGKIIGFGELVQVDDRVGVRLVEVFEHAGG